MSDLIFSISNESPEVIASVDKDFNVFLDIEKVKILLESKKDHPLTIELELYDGLLGAFEAGLENNSEVRTALSKVRLLIEAFELGYKKRISNNFNR